MVLSSDRRSPGRHLPSYPQTELSSSPHPNASTYIIFNACLGLVVHRPRILTASSTGRLPGSCCQRRSIPHKAESLIVQRLLTTGIVNAKMFAGQIGTSVIDTSGKLCWFNEVSPKGGQATTRWQNTIRIVYRDVRLTRTPVVMEEMGISKLL